MKTIFATLAVFVPNLLLACNPNVIEVSRSTSFGFSTSGSHGAGVSQNVSLPVTVNGRTGCYEQRGGLSFEVEEEKRKFVILPPKVEFKKIPDARQRSYALVTKLEDGLKVSLATFLCTGPNVLSVEAFEGTAFNAKMITEFSASMSSTFAIGAAANHLNQAREARMRALGKRTELPAELSEYFEANFTGAYSEIEHYTVSRPSVYLGTSMRSPLSSMDATYSTMVMTKAACSPEFEAVMAPFRFDNLQVPEGVKAKFRRNKLELKW